MHSTEFCCRPPTSVSVNSLYLVKKLIDAGLLVFGIVDARRLFVHLLTDRLVTTHHHARRQVLEDVRAQEQPRQHVEIAQITAVRLTDATQRTL